MLVTWPAITPQANASLDAPIAGVERIANKVSANICNTNQFINYFQSPLNVGAIPPSSVPTMPFPTPITTVAVSPLNAANASPDTREKATRSAEVKFFLL